MPITCPNCDNAIGEERINRDAALTCCGVCGALWPLGGRAEMPRVPVEGEGYRLTFDGGRAQLEYGIGAGTAGRNLGRIILVAGILSIVVDVVILTVILSAHGKSMPSAVAYVVPLLLLLGSCVPIGLGLFILRGKGRLTTDGRSVILRRELWGMGFQRRCVLDSEVRCEWSDSAIVQFQKGTRGQPQTQPQFRPPMSLWTLNGPLNFGFGVPPADRPKVAAALNAYFDAVNLPPDAFTIPRSAALRLPVCPRCSKTVGPASVDVTSVEVDCPFCKTRSPLTIETARAATPEEEERGGPLAPVPRPAKTKIVLDRPGAGRMVVFIPPHGLRGNPLGMFIFAVIWTLFSLGMGVGFGFATLASKEGARAAVFPVLFCLLFVSIGLGMLYFALRGAFSKKFLYIEPERIFLRTIFFGRTKDAESPRTSDLCAELTVAYSQNDVPVYRVQIGSAIKFGSELDDAEKSWLVNEVNRFMAEPEAAAPGA